MFEHEFVRKFAPGEVLFSEGDQSREMFIIQDGEIAVSRVAEGQEIILGRLSKGDFVGEMALLESEPRSATARASRETRCLVIQPGGFLLKIRRDPTFAFEMLQRLSRRIRGINERLLEAIKREDATLEVMFQSIVTRTEYNPDFNLSGLLDADPSTKTRK